MGLKRTPALRAGVLFRAKRGKLHLLWIAGTAVLLMREHKGERREADKQIDEVLECWPGAEEEIHDVPVTAHPIADCDEAPIERSDYDENKRCTT